MSSFDDESVRRFMQETNAPEAVARNTLASHNGNYVRAKQQYLQNRVTSSKQPGLATLSSLNNASSASSHADKKKRNELYAGGHASGIAQLGPSNDDDDDAAGGHGGGDDDGHGHGNDVHDLVGSVMDAARRQGAVDRAALPSDDEEQRFAGQGRRLGDGGVSALVAGKAKPQKLVIAFYRNGFTTDENGPLRRYDDPAQKTILEQINQGRVPDEFRHMMQQAGQVLDVSLIDKKSEDYAPPGAAAAATVQAFVGTGQTLGSSATAATSTAPPVHAGASSRKLVVDESQPTTSLRVRLLDGRQIVVKCNQTHTIADLRAHVDAEAPAASRYIFVCTSMRPPKRDLNESLTVKEADLLNATLHQQQ